MCLCIEKWLKNIEHRIIWEERSKQLTNVTCLCSSAFSQGKKNIVPSLRSSRRRYPAFCSIFLLLVRSEGNKAYPLKLGSATIPVYCHMTDDLGPCGGRGWTLVMKINGNKVVKRIVLLF